MSVTIKGNKRTKREMVIPFEGEEMLVVPKRGGFGQPDMEGYVMAVGNTSRTPTTSSTPQDLPNDPTNTGTSGTGIPIGQPQQPIPTGTSTTNTNPSPAEPLPNEIPTPPVATPQQLCVAPNLWVNGQCLQGGIEQSPAELTCINGGGAWINGACVTSTNPKVVASTTTTLTNTPIVDELPTFPVWSTLDCITLKDKIAEYNAILSTSRFAQNIIDAYNTAIATAQGIYNGKCIVTPPTPITPITPIVEIGGGGFGGGFGGGGGGSAPEEPQPQEEVAPDESGKRIGIILVLALIGGLYFLTRKSN
jgi:hypothetical protein